MIRANDPTQLRAPRAGERTKSQIHPLRHTINLLNGISGYTALDVGFPATPKNYEVMMNDPTIALGMAVKISPIIAGSWSWKVRDNTPNGEQVKAWAQGVFNPMRPMILGSLLKGGLGYGSKSMELIWDVVQRPLAGVPSVRWEIVKFKPLSVHLSRVLIERDHGRFAGVKNGSVELGPGEVLHYPYDFDAEDGGWYGRPLLKNIREPFYEKKQDSVERQKLVKKLTAIIPIAKVLKGMAKDANGVAVDRFETAMTLIAGLAQAKGVAFESILADEADLRANPDLLKVSDMDLSVLDLGSTTQAVGAMLDWRKQFQQEFMQGLLLPPRTALEAQFGSRADAEEQGDVAEIHDELLHQEATGFINRYAVDPMLVYNLGEQYRGAVYAEAAPIRDRNRALLKTVLDKLLTNAATIDLIMSLLDDEALLKQLGLPTRERPIDVTTDLPLPDPPPDNVPVPAANRIGSTFADANRSLVT